MFVFKRSDMTTVIIKCQILALPLRHGGLGLTDPRETVHARFVK